MMGSMLSFANCIHWPQVLVLALLACWLAASIYNHGKPRGLDNAWATGMHVLGLLWLLWAGGFFGGCK